MIDVEELEDDENVPMPTRAIGAKLSHGFAASDGVGSRHKEHARILAIQHR